MNLREIYKGEQATEEEIDVLQLKSLV